MKKIIIILSLVFSSLSAFADEEAMSFIYQEKETGTDPVIVRYLVNKLFLRIDNGGLQDDFLLFNRKTETIYNVNQDDMSILVIKPSKWRAPKFPFDIKVNKKILVDAPEIMGKKVLDYSKVAAGELCHQLKIVPDVYKKDMQAFIEYQNILSGQQVKILNNTPKEMQTPCLLVDQVFNAGDYYQLGLPIQESHSRGYVKSLKDYKKIKLKAEFFVLPKDFKEYSISN